LSDVFTVKYLIPQNY